MQGFFKDMLRSDGVLKKTTEVSYIHQLVAASRNLLTAAACGAIP
jgi:hypothetical protein